MAGNRNSLLSGKQSFLHPISPLPSMYAANTDYSSSSIVSNGVPKTNEGQRRHQRAPSESFLSEDQPSWLDDLLKEPETPVKRGTHRRSSSDSFAYLDACSTSLNGGLALSDYKNKSTVSVPSWNSLNFDCHREVPRNYYNMGDLSSAQHIKSRNSSLKSLASQSGYSLLREINIVQGLGSSCGPREADGVPSSATVKKDEGESSPCDVRRSSERKDSVKPSASETDQKRTKQQHAQRSRVRKLQYIAELERNIQALQAEGLDVSAELEFIGQQNLILSMENTALKQRLDNLAQGQLIKHFERDLLEREIKRLRALLYQQQIQKLQPQEQQPSRTGHHRGGSSRDLHSQFANLSLRHNEASSGREPVNGPLHI